MKIYVEFLRAEQHWSPDTGGQQNYLIFGFGGLEHRIPCEEDDIVEAIREAQNQKVGAEVTFRNPPAPVSSGTFQQYPDGSTVSFTGVDGETDGTELDREFDTESTDQEAAPEAPVAVPPLTFHKSKEPERKPIPTQNAMEQRKEMINAGLSSRPRTTASIKAANLERARAVASRAPVVRRVAADDMGNPIVPEAHQVSGPAPTVRVAKPREMSDDDAFGQG